MDDRVKNTPEDCPLIDSNGDYVGPERRSREAFPSRSPQDWHLDKTVSVTQIGALILVVISGTMWFMNQDKRIDLNGANIAGNAKQILAEREARQQADMIHVDRLNRHEVDQKRTEDRLFQQLDQIHQLLRELAEARR